LYKIVCEVYAITAKPQQNSFHQHSKVVDPLLVISSQASKQHRCFCDDMQE